MKQILLIFLLCLATVYAPAQTMVNPATQIRWPQVSGSGTPTSLNIPCSSTNYTQPYQNVSVTPNTFYTCGSDGWVIRSTAGAILANPTGSQTITQPANDNFTITGAPFITPQIGTTNTTTTASGTWNFTGTVNFESGAATYFSGGIDSTNFIEAGIATSATSTSNYNGSLLEWQGDYWNGTGNTTDIWTSQDILGSGTNPTSTLTFSHSGTSGTSTIALPALEVAGSPVCTSATGCTSGATAGVTQIVGPTATEVGSVTFAGSGVTQSGSTFTFGGAYPYPGIPYFTSATAGTVATSAQIQSQIGTGVYLPSSTSLVSGVTGPSSTVTGDVTITGPAVSQSGNTLTINTAAGSFFALSPTTNQTVTQGNYTTTYTATPTAFQNGGFKQTSTTLNLYAPGYDLGPSGTSAQGWSVGEEHTDTMMAGSRGIMQRDSINFSHFGIGDTADRYGYLTAYGGKSAYSDEGVSGLTQQVHQVGDFYGPLTTGAGVGSTLISTNSMNCSGYCLTLDTRQFPDGGIMLDLTQSKGTVTLGAVTTTSLVASGTLTPYYPLTSGTVTPSTAWGQIISSSCTGNGNGQGQTYTSTTCNVTLGTAPASPGAFVSGQDIFLSGPFEEEAAVTAVGLVSGGVQSVTFSTRYAWNNYNPIVMQGGPGGLSFATGANQPAYFVIGATSTTNVFFGNCVAGVCNSTNGVLPGSGTVETLYPSAEIIGTNGGQSGYANLATNTVNWTLNDTIEGAPTSEFQGDALRLVYGQTTPIDGGQPSAIVSVQDDGPSYASEVFYGGNNATTSSIGGAWGSLQGSFANDFNIGYRPATGGAVIYEQGGEPNGEANTAYNIFFDDTAGLAFGADTVNGVFTMNHGLQLENPLALVYSYTGGVKSVNLQSGLGQLTGSCGTQAVFQFSATAYGQPANLSYCDGVNSWLPLFQMNTANTSVNLPAASTAGSSTICTAADSATTTGCGVGASTENAVTSTTTALNPNDPLNTVTLSAAYSFTLAAPTNPVAKTCLLFVQNSTGTWVVTPPSNVHNFMTVSTTASTKSMQCLVYSPSLALWIGEGDSTTGFN